MVDYESASRLEQDFGSYVPGTRMPYHLTPAEKRALGPSPRGNLGDQGIARSIAFSLAKLPYEEDKPVIKQEAEPVRVSKLPKWIRNWFSF